MKITNEKEVQSVGHVSPNTLINGDCLEVMKSIPSNSIDCILCDPPYGTIEGVAAGDVSHGMKGKTKWDKVIDHVAMLEQCNRILRTNGTLALFAQDPYTAKLTTDTHGNLPFSYRMTWLKDHFANSLLAKKAPVNYTEDVCLFFKRHPCFNEHPLGSVVKLAQESASLFWNRGLPDIYVKKGWAKTINNAKAVLKHSLNWNYVQFSAPSKEQYERISQFLTLPEHGEMLRVCAEYKALTPRVFNLPEGQKFKSNVLEYKKDYTGLHPTQKPVALMEDLIRTYTNEGETVLDFTAGSFTTGVACVDLNRKFIGIELDKDYFDIGVNRIKERIKHLDLKIEPTISTGG